MPKYHLKRLGICFFFGFLLIIVLPAQAHPQLDGLADTAWPMYQHDPQHTGRSPLIGPVRKPELLWTTQLDGSVGENGGISIAKDGSLLVSIGGRLFNFDPVSRQIRWMVGGDHSRGVALVGIDDSLYWGFGMLFTQISSDGEYSWVAALDPNYTFGSSATFDSAGNIYFVHDGVWSFTSNGDIRWIVPHTWFSHASPAVGLDGRIYANGAKGLCAFQPSGAADWCFSQGEDRTPALNGDGTIYLASDNGYLSAYTSEGILEWRYTPPISETLAHIPDGLAIASNGSLRFGVNAGDTSYLYSIDSGGQLEWKAAFSKNTLTGLVPMMRYPITVDRDGKSFVCPENSVCYAVDIDGDILWEYEFPLNDSIIVTGGTQPVIADDGLIYIADNRQNIYAFADPGLYPILATSQNEIAYTSEPGAENFITTLTITSTVSAISYTAAISPTANWISIRNPIDKTPSHLELEFKVGSHTPGRYNTTIEVKPSQRAGKWLQIPVTLNIINDQPHQVYLPGAYYDYSKPHRILHLSTWFEETQIASIGQSGTDRVRITSIDDLGQVEIVEYAPDGEKAAVIALLNHQYNLTVLDLQSGEKILEIPVISYGRPAWSPDSERIAVSSYMEYSPGEVYIANLDGSGITRLTDNDVWEESLFWSPLGDKIAVEINKDIYLVNVDGTDFHEVDYNQLSAVPLGWSPDGKHLLVKSWRDYTAYDLGIINIDTNTTTFLDNFYREDVSWSPDGKYIAYLDMELDLMVIRPDGSARTNLTNGVYRDNMQPVWSPNAQWLAFSGQTSNYDIFVIRPDGTELKQITTNIQRDSYPFWQP